MGRDGAARSGVGGVPLSVLDDQRRSVETETVPGQKPDATEPAHGSKGHALSTDGEESRTWRQVRVLQPDVDVVAADAVDPSTDARPETCPESLRARDGQSGRVIDVPGERTRPDHGSVDQWSRSEARPVQGQVADVPRSVPAEALAEDFPDECSWGPRAAGDPDGPAEGGLRIEHGESQFHTVIERRGGMNGE
jgi:hypothetical protein